MSCPNCGVELNKDNHFCTNCGQKIIRGTDALVKFHSIKNHVESHRRFLNGEEQSEQVDTKTAVDRAMYNAFDEQLRKGWGDNFIKKSHEIEDKADVLKILQDEVKAKRISSDDIREIFNSKDFQSFITSADIVLVVKMYADKWEDFSILEYADSYRNRIVKTSGGFIGRHQELILVRERLGESFTITGKKLASDKDFEERDVVLHQIQDLEIYVNSDLFVSHEGAQITAVNKLVEKIINDGYGVCVLQNDAELEKRIFKIDEYMDVCAQNLFIKKGKPVPEEILKASKEVPTLLSLRGFWNWASLGTPTLLDTGELQRVWLMITSLLHPQKKIGVLNADNFLTQIIGSSSKKNIDSYISALRDTRKKLLESKHINEEEGSKIDLMIEDGLLKNKEIQEQYPDRP